jgi:hypothetical protein
MRLAISFSTWNTRSLSSLKQDAVLVEARDRHLEGRQMLRCQIRAENFFIERAGAAASPKFNHSYTAVIVFAGIHHVLPNVGSSLSEFQE